MIFAIFEVLGLVPGNFRSHVLSLPGAKVPWVELSFPGTFAPWNFRSLELSFQLELSLPGTFAPWNFRSLELSLPFVKDEVQIQTCR